MMEGVEVDEAAHVSVMDRFKFWLENYMTRDQMSRFYLLLWPTLVIVLILAALFAHPTNHDFPTSVYLIFQDIATGGYDDSLTDAFAMVIHVAAICTGIAVFSVLIGFVNEMIMNIMLEFSQGRSKVACEGHTLILGWNECTVRCVCQLAFLRRTYLMQNESCVRRCFPWRRVSPSTPAAAAKVVIMCNTKTKEEMDQTLKEAFRERGILRKWSCVGRDIVCRIGDPSEPHDVMRVGAHRARAVLVLRNNEDDAAERDGGLKNTVSLETLLALKHAIFQNQSPDNHDFWDDFRCVVHVDEESEIINAAKFKSPSGRDLVNVVNLQPLVNGVILSCGLNPRLPNVLLDLLDFDGVAFRVRNARDLGIVGKTVASCSLIWEDAVFCGVMNKHQAISAVDVDVSHGLACHPLRIITRDDRVIFASSSSMPKLRTLTPPGDCSSRTSRVSSGRNLGQLQRAPPRAFHTLVCGWRKQWSDGRNLFKRIELFASNASPGNKVVFLNMLQAEDFAAILDSAVNEHGQQLFRKNQPGWEVGQVSVFHFHGNPGDPDAVRTVMSGQATHWDVQSDRAFEVAIVLGTTVDDLPKVAQDRVMLARYVLVHQIHREIFGDAIPLHVIGETNFDSTVVRAHAVALRESRKDLVNTQAMFARGLILALLFRKTHTFVSQLFTDVPGTPHLRLFWIGREVIPSGRFTFADVTCTVAEHQDMPGAVCLGVVVGDQIFLAPNPDNEYDFHDGDFVIVLERGFYDVEKLGSAYHKRESQESESHTEGVPAHIDEQDGDEDAMRGKRPLMHDSRTVSASSFSRGYGSG